MNRIALSLEAQWEQGIEKPKHSHTRLSTFLRCRKLYLLNATYTGLGTNLNLVVGGMVHAGLARFHLQPNKMLALQEAERSIEEYKIRDENIKDIAKAATSYILMGYFETYRDDPVKFRVTETPFEEEIKKGYWFKGKIDGVAEWNKQLYIGEHKTSSWNGAPFWEGLERSNQLPAYVWAGNKLFPDWNIGGHYLLNVLFKPSDKAKASFERQFKTMPDWRVKKWEDETCNVIDDVETAWAKGVKGFYENPDRCRDYNAKCEYWDYCSGGCSADIIKDTHQLTNKEI